MPNPILTAWLAYMPFCTTTNSLATLGCAAPNPQTA